MAAHIAWMLIQGGWVCRASNGAVGHKDEDMEEEEEEEGDDAPVAVLEEEIIEENDLRNQFPQAFGGCLG